MMAAASYDPNRAAGGFDAEVERLRVQMSLSWDVESRRLLEMGLCDGMRILELGCGPGWITQSLRQLLPSSPITALDYDPALLARARAHNLSQVSFVEGEAAATGLAADSFDWVLSRYLFQHLSSPEAAAQEAFRVLRPGGRHVVIDIDDELWGLAAPSIPGLRTIFAKQTPAQAAQGGNRRIGRRLWHLLHQAGYADVRLDVFAYHSGATGIAPFLPQISPERLVSSIDPRQLSLEELGLLYAGHEAFTTMPDAWLLLVGFIASGTKP